VRAVALAAGLLVAALGVGRGDDPPLPEVATALARIASASTIELTTTGRQSGREHTERIWFVVADGKILVQAGDDGKRDWYQNLKKTPAVVVHHGDYTFRARAVPVTDPGRVREIHELFLHKYPSARLLSWFGSSIGQGQPAELVPLSVAVQRAAASR